MKPDDEHILEANIVEAVLKTGEEPVPAVSLIVSKSDIDYEIIISSDELRTILDACDLEKATDKNEARLKWLHDCSAGQTDLEGYEWGIYRVKWENGQAVSVVQTLSDFSDLDAEMERERWKGEGAL